MTEKDVIYYRTDIGKEPFSEWLATLKDSRTQLRIERRIQRLSIGHYGDYKTVGRGILELRFHFGSSYRVYFGEDGDTIVLILFGGDKSSQSKDIDKAKDYWQDYLAYKGNSE